MENEIQFDQVERPAGASTCANCRGALFGSYFQANGQVLCERCAENIRRFLTSSEGAFGRVVKAVVLGIVGGLGGAAVYTGVLAFLHIDAAIVTILIGWMVGKMVRKGSGGRGGLGFQILAVLITYVMIGLSSGASGLVAGEAHIEGAFQIIVVLVLSALAGPVYNATHSLLGIVIIGAGLLYAWRLNAPIRLNITGPHTIAAAVPSRPVAPTADADFAPPTAPPTLPLPTTPPVTDPVPPPSA
jgi:hypothetical protein